MKLLRLLCLVSCLAACQHPPAAEAPAAPAPQTPEARGRAFVQANCARCHATGPIGSSPNPVSPPFAAIVNRHGLTAQTLSSWLSNAHNYPQEMQFQLGGADIDDLVAYMLTLKDPDYRPPAQ